MESINNSEVKKHLIKLLHDRFNITLNQGQCDTLLTSKEIGLTGFELAHLFFEIEKIYSKSFEARILKDYGFCTINNITKAIIST